MHERYLPIVRLSILAAAVAFSGTSLSASTQSLRGKVTEVKGAFCKIDLGQGEGVAQGAAGSLYRAPNGTTPVGRVTITAVKETYSVGKVTGTTPRVGDVAVFSPASETEPSGEAGESETVARLRAAVGTNVDVKLKSGKALFGVKLTEVEADEQTGKVRKLKVLDPARERPTTVSATAIESVLVDGDVIRIDVARPEPSKSGTNSGGSGITSGGKEPQPKRPTAREFRAAKEKALAEARAKKEAEEKEAYLARLRERGVRPWPELTEEQHEAEIEAHREMMKKVAAVCPGMQLFETEKFLFFTNIPRQQALPYAASLDAMHEMLRKLYGIPKDERVWKGKCLVFAFLHQQQFQAFEATFMNNPNSTGAYGLCHQDSTGRVIISCYRGDQVAEFGKMLVHETSHGFIHRYKTPVHIPSWVNEGMAEWVGQALVPASRSVAQREAQARERMLQTRSLGGNYFVTNQNIEFWQYGIASGMTKFMMKANPQAYIAFIQDLKEGRNWRESLEDRFKATLEQFVYQYGMVNGIPGVRP